MQRMAVRRKLARKPENKTKASAAKTKATPARRASAAKPQATPARRGSATKPKATPARRGSATKTKAKPTKRKAATGKRSIQRLLVDIDGNELCLLSHVSVGEPSEGM